MEFQDLNWIEESLISQGHLIGIIILTRLLVHSPMSLITKEQFAIVGLINLARHHKISSFLLSSAFILRYHVENIFYNF